MGKLRIYIVRTNKLRLFKLKYYFLRGMPLSSCTGDQDSFRESVERMENSSTQFSIGSLAGVIVASAAARVGRFEKQDSGLVYSILLVSMLVQVCTEPFIVRGENA